MNICVRTVHQKERVPHRVGSYSERLHAPASVSSLHPFQYHSVPYDDLLVVFKFNCCMVEGEIFSFLGGNEWCILNICFIM